MTKRTMTTLLLFLLAAALMPSLSTANFQIDPGSVQVKTLDQNGEPELEAGSHPDRLTLDFNIEGNDVGTAARDLIFEFAPGLTGSPVATKTCTRAIFELEACPTDTQVGRFTAIFTGGGFFDEPVYNLEPAPNQLAVLGFHPLWLTELELKLRPDDFGLNISTTDMPQLPIEDGHIELWGVPSDHNGASEGGAFLTTPTECGPMKFTLRTRSWQVNAPWLTEPAESEPFNDCTELPFEPSLALHLTNPRPDSLTGADIDLNVAEHIGPEEPASANIKDVHIDFPAGLTLAPDGVEGRQSCTDAQFGLGTESAVTCPFQSRVGSVKVSTPALGESLDGSLYLGKELPGERFRLFLQAAAQGIQYKTLATLATDPVTGRLSTALNGLPQFPVGQISLDFEGGPHALLATPLTCGPTPAQAHFVPSTGGAPVDSSTSVTISGSCPAALPFAPVTVAGSTDLGAGQNTGFGLTLTRQEDEQLPRKYSLTLPPGLSANLSSVSICPSAAAAAGTCGAASKIGSAIAEVGSGPNPAHLAGSVYLSSAYEDAPFGLSIVFRAAIGPFDLGTLNVQATLRIDPHTGQVSLGHLLPTIFEGIPVRFRNLGIDFPRSGFLVNPTSCGQEQLLASVTAVDGRVANSSVPFSVSGCDSLGFRPKFSAALDQQGKHARSPELSFAVNMPSGNANLKSFKVRFPSVLKFHNSAVQEVCPRAAAFENRCRPGSRVGVASAVSPLLRMPLRGPVYLVQPQDKKGSPDLWTNVAGEGVELQLRSQASEHGGRLTTEFVEIPDLPLANFSMKVSGASGKGSLFSLKKDGCGAPGALTTPVGLEGQNGASQAISVQLKAAGCAKAGGKKRNRRGRAQDRGR